jgi:gliding motility-associated-like protein
MITEPEKINITTQIKNAFACDNPASGSIDITVRGGSSPYTFQWSNGSNTEDLTGITSGSYYVLVTDSKGCTNSSQFEIMRQKPVDVSVSSYLSFDCKLKKLKMISNAIVNGGVAPYRFFWSMGTISGANNETMETSQNSVVSLVVTDSLGCTASYSYSVDVPTIGIDFNPLDCSKYYYQFNAIKSSVELNGITYLWDFGDGTSSSMTNPTHFFNKTGSYKVKLTVSGVSCSSIFEETIYVSPESRLKLDRDPKICMGDSLVLKVVGAYSYKWSDGTNSDSIIIKQPGDYIVIGTTLNGCKDTLNFTTSYYDLYNYTIQSDSDNVTSGSYPLHLWSDNIPFTQYFWDFGDGTMESGVNVYHTFNIQTDGFYDVKLKAISPSGCTETTTKRIWITVPTLPNTFSPNGDGVNERFLENWKIQVYSRNGIILYTGTDGWDGKYKGQDVSGGIYFYVLYYPGESGTKTTSGYVRLIR